MSEAVHALPTPVEAQDALPGRRLAEARQSQNLTPADVARQLKLSVWQVEALEAGRYHELPGAIFVRGFIRNYARLLKLDADELLRAGSDSLPQPPARRDTPPSRDIPFPSPEAPRRPLYALAVVAIVGTLAIYEYYWNEPEATVTRRAAPASPAPAGPARAESPPMPAAVSGSAAPSVAEAHATAVTSGPETTAAAAPAGGDLQAEAERTARPGERQVKLEFDDESWVEIRDRNERVIFSQLNRPGTHQFVHGLPPFSIVVGNAQGVRLTYEDQPVDLARHTKIDVARLILQ